MARRNEHILLIRFSAMGDVAMLVPVLNRFVAAYPAVKVTVLSNKFFEPMFSGIPNVNFVGADLKGRHSNVFGLMRLVAEIKKDHRIRAVADVHNVLRSKIIRRLFPFKKKAVIDKGRDKKKLLTRKENKVLKQLKTSHERYADVFAKLGYPISLQAAKSFKAKEVMPAELKGLLIPGKKLLGVAPFAQHQPKQYPLERLKESLHQLTAKGKYQLLFFGGGEKETNLLKTWEKEFSGSLCIAGRLSLDKELSLISNLFAMLSMDSSNMHLASMYGVRTVSIWGATHPFAGFLGWMQSEDDVVQADLYCRPCSVFGNKPCYRGDHACMHMIDPTEIVNRVDVVKI